VAARDNRFVRQIPNALTLGRLVVVPIFIGLMLYHGGSTMGRGILFGAAAWTDFFDGRIARRLQVQSQFGKVVDPLADRLLTNSGAMLLSFLEPERFPVWAFLLIVWRDIAAIYGMLRLRRHVLVADVSKTGKYGMFLMMTGITWLLILDNHTWPIWFFWVGFVMSLVALAQYVWRYRFTLKAPESVPDTVARKAARREGVDAAGSNAPDAPLYSEDPAGAGRGGS
jgi:CDP-diacylglycerol--glycerol-3-phosphate 3-phosphatidyltransferase